MPDVHFDDALNYLINQLANVPGPGSGQATARQQKAHGSDIWIDLISGQYWSEAHQIGILNLSQDEKEPYVAPFYDAAWELCRRGVLRPGASVPAGQTNTGQMGARINAAAFFGDGYALTRWGREWVKKAVVERAILPADPSRLAEVLLQFKNHFGDGYAQRAAEAVSVWRTGNYLSACTMSGAAAESILLATAIAKAKDEAKILAEYRASGGRMKVIKRVIGSAPKGVADQFSSAMGLLSYWRDDAAHGTATGIGEIEAHEALSRLLRLAQFTSDNWGKLTT